MACLLAMQVQAAAARAVAPAGWEAVLVRPQGAGWELQLHAAGTQSWGPVSGKGQQAAGHKLHTATAAATGGQSRALQAGGNPQYGAPASGTARATSNQKGEAKKPSEKSVRT